MEILQVNQRRILGFDYFFRGRIGLLLVMVFMLSSCSIFKFGKVKTKNGKEYEVVNASNINQDSSIKELKLHIHNIETALDGVRKMWEVHGDPDSTSKGQYQSNIDSYIWTNARLLGDDKVFIVIVDGTETPDDFFASFQVYDESENNCLSDTHEHREEVINAILKMMEVGEYKVK